MSDMTKPRMFINNSQSSSVSVLVFDLFAIDRKRPVLPSFDCIPHVSLDIACVSHPCPECSDHPGLCSCGEKLCMRCSGMAFVGAKP